MKKLANLAFLVLASGGMAFGQTTSAAGAPYDAPSQNSPYPQNPPAQMAPYGQPPAGNQVQVVQPGSQTPQPQGPETIVVGAPMQALLLPFSPVGDDAVSHYAWISQALDESLKANLARDPAVQFQGGAAPASDANNSTATRDHALNAAKKVNASIVIFGSYQIVSDQVRVLGEVLSVSNGLAVAQINATGAVRDLFQIEDSVNAQLSPALPGAGMNAGNTAMVANVPEANDYSYQVPMQSAAPNTTYYYPNYSPTDDYAYGYPYDYDYSYAPYYYGGYGYPYGLYGGGLFFYGGYGYGHYGHFYGHGYGHWYGGGHGVYHGPVHAFGGTGGFHASGGGGFHGGGFGGGFHGGGGGHR